MPLKSILFSFVFVGFSLFLKAQDIRVKKLENRLSISTLNLNMPKNQRNLAPHMGLMGIHYTSNINKNLYLGTGVYAAMTGDQGGLFTLDITLGYKKEVLKNLVWDTQFHFGGGGGYRHLINDGAFIHMLTGLLYKSPSFDFGLHYSYFDFYTGIVKDQGLQFSVHFPTAMFISEKTKHDSQIDMRQLKYWPEKHNNSSFSAQHDLLFPINKSRAENGSLLSGKVLYSLGFVYQKELSQKHFVFLQTDAIYKGMRAGFMDIFIGMGLYPMQTNKLKSFIKLGVGGSGGRIAKEGGATIYPSAGLHWQLLPRWSTSLHGGYYRALDGYFEAFTTGLSLSYQMSYGKIANTQKKYRLRNFDVGLFSQRFFNVNKYDPPFVFVQNQSENNLNNAFNATDYRYQTDLDLIALRGSYKLNKTISIVGEAAFAYAGASGGYAHGLFGFGLSSPLFLNQKLQLESTLFLGAGGGAGVDTGEGLLGKWDSNVKYLHNNNVHLTAGLGKLFVFSNSFNNWCLQAGLIYQFGLLENL